MTLEGFCEGIDVSSCQRIEDADAAYASGIRFAFVKSSEGLTGHDPRAIAHLQALGSAGILCGTYGFARVQQGNPRQQARTIDVGSTHIVRVALDLETAPTGGTADQLLDFAEQWLDEVSLTGACPLLYSYTSFLDQRLSGARLQRLLDRYPLWLAQYRSVTVPWRPSTVADLPTRYPWTIYQYSGNGGFRVPGIAGDCDRNLFRGDEAALRSWFGL